MKHSFATYEKSAIASERSDANGDGWKIFGRAIRKSFRPRLGTRGMLVRVIRNRGNLDPSAAQLAAGLLAWTTPRNLPSLEYLRPPA